MSRRAGIATLLLFGAACAVLVVAATIFIQNFDPFACETTVYRKIPSPLGDLVAFVFEKDCGATTPFNTQVALAPAKSQRDWQRILSISGRHDITAKWLNNRTLVIAIPKSEKTYRKITSTLGVTIAYK